jgi:long-chain acyl-CoA synthetase
MKNSNNLYSLFLQNANLHPNKTILYDGKKKITFGKLSAYVDSIATYLTDYYGVKKGDNIGIFLNNGWEYIAIVFAIFKVGAVAVPINSYLKSNELSYIIKDADINLLFAHDELIKIVNGSIAVISCGQVVWVGDGVKGTRFDRILELKSSAKEIDIKADDNAAIFYTSGSTGKPKGAILSHKNILTIVPFLKSHLNLNSRDKVLLFIPMFHGYAFCIGLIAPILNSISIAIVRSVNPIENLIKEAVNKKVTIFLGVPEIYNALLKTKLPWGFNNLNRIKIVVSGGSFLSSETIYGILEKLPKATLIEGYGLSESASIVAVNPIKSPKIGSVGKVANFCEVKIVDENGKILETNEIGEIAIRGENVTKEYLNCDCKNIIDGWLHTGDLGYMDKDGYLYLKGRKDDVIISRGFNIYPKEVEDVLDRYPGVIKSAVVGTKDKSDGEVPIAFLETTDMQTDQEKIKKYADGFLASYKVPKEFIIVEKLPRTASGKIVKYKLKEIYLNS